MRRIVEFAVFFTLATVLGTIGFRLYQSPDGQAIWDFFGSKQQPKSWQQDWIKEVKIPEWKWDQGAAFLPKDWTFGGVGGGVESPWKGTIYNPSAESRPARTQNQSTPAKLFSEQMKVHSERMKAHTERMKAHNERMNSARSWGGRQNSAPTTGPGLSQNQFAN